MRPSLGSGDILVTWAGSLWTLFVSEQLGCKLIVSNPPQFMGGETL